MLIMPITPKLSNQYKLGFMLLYSFHLAHNPKVVGSNPTPATKIIWRGYGNSVTSFSLLEINSPFTCSIYPNTTEFWSWLGFSFPEIWRGLILSLFWLFKECSRSLFSMTDRILIMIPLFPISNDVYKIDVKHYVPTR